MPDFLLDSGVFITARLGPYGFEIAPGFWEILDEHITAGIVMSPDAAYQELTTGANNELAEWIKARKDSGLFLPMPDKKIQANYGAVSNYVLAEYDISAASRFLRGADGWLIAHAMDCGATVVTCEVDNRPGKGRVKIPDVCRAFNVASIGLWRFVRTLKFRLTR